MKIPKQIEIDEDVHADMLQRESQGNFCISKWFDTMYRQTFMNVKGEKVPCTFILDVDAYDKFEQLVVAEKIEELIKEFVNPIISE